MPRSASYAVVVLGILTRDGNQNLNQIATKLFSNSYPPYSIKRSFPKAINQEDLHHAISGLLEDFIELGIVGRTGDNQFSIGNIPPRNPTPPGNDEPPENAGSGLAQVLSHRYMFSYTNEDFDELVERTLRNFNNE
jgi:hypothetical protein